jgi:hypothetical protein
MLKKELAPGIAVYRPEFKNLENSLNIIKHSLDNHTTYLNPQVTDENEHLYVNGKREGWIKISDESTYIKTGVHTDNIKMIEEKGLNKNPEELEVLTEIYDILAVCFQDYFDTYKNANLFYPYVEYDKKITENKKYWLKDYSVHKHEKQLLNNDGTQEAFWEDISKIKSNSQGLTLGWHPDTAESSITSGIKHLVTGNIYYNDDYVGGRILFLYGNDMDSLDNFENLKIIAYKPKAGDTVLYPANWPVVHSVSTPFENDIYIASQIVKYDYDGSMGEKLSKYILHDKLDFNDYSQKVKKENIKLIDGKNFFND